MSVVIVSVTRSFRALALVAILVLGSCERRELEVIEPEPAAIGVIAPISGPGSSSSEAASRIAMQQGRDARAVGDYTKCEEKYAAAARNAAGADGAYHLYEAARCAARAGKFDRSIGHLYGAATAGYPQLADVQTDPLLRPLYGSRRWQLVLDTVAENQRRQPSSDTALCTLFKRVTSAATEVAEPVEPALAHW